jgi:energy-coupling factor transport system permease protein
LTAPQRPTAAVPPELQRSTAAPAAARPAFVPDFVDRPAEGRYRRLLPTTKLAIAFAEALIAIGVRGWTGPLVVAAVAFSCAVYAGVARRTLVVVAITAPLVISIVVVNTFGFPSAPDVIGRIGPLTATWTGLTAAGQAVLRVAAFALSVALFSLTTSVDALLADLERRGLGRRGSFIIGAALGMIPRIGERAAEVTDAQRARGLDTEGSWRKRVGGLVPLIGPVIIGSLTEVEERTMALEARGFSAPIKRTALRSVAERPLERALRWVVAVGALVLLGLSITGRLEALP